MKCAVLCFALGAILPATASSYDPLENPGEVTTRLTSFQYGDRTVPLKIHLPDAERAPVLLLSHGLGGSREVGTYLGEHWAARGFVVVAMQHVGSDESVWKDLPPAERMAKLQSAASGATFLDRTRDVPATLDQLEAWNAAEEHFLHGRLDLDHVGLGGHSYGAVTTQALCGQAFGAAGPRFADSRIDAGLALSPSPPARGDAKRAFAGVTLPMMLMTGTEDRSAIGRTTPAGRREVYPAMPAGGKYELVLEGAEHMAFSDRSLRGREHRNPAHHRVILALSTAFWEAHLLDEAEARKWLDDDTPGDLLAPGDVWQRK